MNPAISEERRMELAMLLASRASRREVVAVAAEADGTRSEDSVLSPSRRGRRERELVASGWVCFSILSRVCVAFGLLMYSCLEGKEGREGKRGRKRGVSACTRQAMSFLIAPPPSLLLCLPSSFNPHLITA